MIRERKDHQKQTSWLNNRPLHEYTVRSCVPDLFEAYCKIFHPPFIIQDVPEHEWQQQREEHQKQCFGNVSGITVCDTENPSYTRTTWASILAQQGLIFHPEVSVRSLYQFAQDGQLPINCTRPREGALEDTDGARLAHILSSVCQARDVFFYYDGLAIYENHQPMLFHGPITEFQSDIMLDHTKTGETPSYWWPSDSLDWCVHTNDDLCVSIVAGSRALIDALLQDPILETLEVTPHTTVSWNTDETNSTIAHQKQLAQTDANGS